MDNRRREDYLRAQLTRVAATDTAPVRRLVEWMLDRDAPMNGYERSMLQDCFDAIQLWESDHDEDTRY